MPADPPYDPAAEWQKFVQSSEQTINAMSGHITGTQEFGALIAQLGMIQRSSKSCSSLFDTRQDARTGGMSLARRQSALFLEA